MIDLRNALYSSSANSFKNTGVYTTSVSLSGSVAAGATATFTSTITLNENQVFTYFTAEYADLAKVIFGITTKFWQRSPSGANAYIPTTPSDSLGADINARVNGNVVTFIAVLFNPYGTPETITPTTINIRYVTYTTTE
jgi:hypothetical protein